MREGHNLPERMRSIRKYIHALHCHTGGISSIASALARKVPRRYTRSLMLGEAGMTFAGLYYHLSALKGAGIIEVASYRETKGAIPEKVWKLKTTKL